MRRGQRKHASLGEVDVFRRKDDCIASLLCLVGRKALNVVEKQENLSPGFLGQLNATRVLSEFPCLSQIDVR